MQGKGVCVGFLVGLLCGGAQASEYNVAALRRNSCDFAQERSASPDTVPLEQTRSPLTRFLCCFFCLFQRDNEGRSARREAVSVASIPLSLVVSRGFTPPPDIHILENSGGDLALSEESSISSFALSTVSLRLSSVRNRCLPPYPSGSVSFSEADFDGESV